MLIPIALYGDKGALDGTINAMRVDMGEPNAGIAPKFAPW
jgi:hypothetical protein